MALDAFHIGADKMRLRGFIDVHRIEDDALGRIERGEFHHVAPSHKTHGHVVVEINRARLFGEIFGPSKLVFENTSICESGLMSSCLSRLGR